MTKLMTWITLVVAIAAVRTFSQESLSGSTAAQTRSQNRLVTAKLVAVTPMPNGLDQWLIDDLRAWGKYRVTADPEGADLIIRGYNPEREPQYKMHRGIPQPKREKHQAPPVLSISAIDWVNNESIWEADIINKKSKEGESDPAPGPQTEIYVGGLSPDQLAQKLTSRLRAYVSKLEQKKVSR